MWWAAGAACAGVSADRRGRAARAGALGPRGSLSGARVVGSGGAGVPILFLSPGDAADTHRGGGAGSAALQRPEGQGHHPYLGPDRGCP